MPDQEALNEGTACKTEDDLLHSGIFAGTLMDLVKRRERFIPVRLPTIVNYALQDESLSPNERTGLKSLFEMMQARFHFEFHDQLKQLLDDYSPFDPDTDIVFHETLSEKQKEACRQRFSGQIHNLLIQCNYTQLSRDQLREILSLQTLARIAIKVDLGDFHEIRIYHRGVDRVQHKIQPWLEWLPGWFRKRFGGPNTVIRFRRIVLVAKTQDGQILLKLFKDILLRDLKIVSPTPQIKMPLFDRLKLGSTLLGSLVTPLVKLLFAAAFNIVLFLMLLVAFVTASVKVTFSFISCRTKYMRALSTNLYYQSLSNNACVLNRLVNTAEDEEVKEMLLAYYMLHRHRDTGLTKKELDQAVQQWIQDQFDLEVDFEVSDAISKLQEKELLEVTQETYKAVALQESLRVMDQMWDNIFPYANEEEF